VETNLQLKLRQNRLEALKNLKNMYVRNVMMLKFEAQTRIYLGGQEKNHA
jgi:hypothetical protein